MKHCRLVFMFSGQGAQYYQMARELLSINARFQKEMEILDMLARDIIGESVMARIYDPRRVRSEDFDRLLHTHPALFMQQYALARVLMADGLIPDAVMGTSLGELVAAAVAGVMSVQNALDAVIRQAKAIEAHAPPGGMVAVMAAQTLYNCTGILRENSEVAGVNFSGHFVLSGGAEGLERVMEFLEDRKIIHLRLPIRWPAHSSLMEQVEPFYRANLEGLQMNQPEMEFISCTRARPLREIRSEYFWEVVRNPMRFMETIQETEKRGPCQYVDMGPSGTLANFTKHNLTRNTGSKTFHILTPFGRDAESFEKAIAAITADRSACHNCSKTPNRISLKSAIPF